MNYRDNVIEKLSTLIKVLDTENKLTAQQYDEFSKAMDEYDRCGIGEFDHEGHINYFLYTQDGGQYAYHFDDDVDENEFYTKVAKAIAFSDLSDTSIFEIVYNGHKKRYVGWQPNMLYEFKDEETGRLEWSQYFPEWDH